MQQSLYTELHPSDCLAAARALVHTAVAAADSDTSNATTATNNNRKQNTFTVALVAEALRSLHQPQQQQHTLQQSAQSCMWPVCTSSIDSPLKGSVLTSSKNLVGSDSSALSTPGAAWGAWMLRTLLQLEVAEAASADTFHAGAYNLLAL
jgi:hypothetical protein